jgi:hypothetical protein
LLEAELVEDANHRGFVFDPAGNVLRVELDSGSLPWPPMRADPIFLPLRTARAALYLRRSLTRARHARRDGMDGYQVTRIPLTTGSAEGVRGLSFEQEAIDEPQVPGVFDVVRAANILNLSYFRDTDLVRMIRAILKRVAADGFLLVLRTGADGINRGTMYHRSHDGLAVLEHLNGGSEVQTLVAAVGADLVKKSA